MKAIKLSLVLTLCLILLHSTFATTGSSVIVMGASVEYEDVAISGTATAEAFNLTMAGASQLRIGEGSSARDVNTLIFTSETGSAGIYSKQLTGTLRRYTGVEARVTVNGAAYTLKHVASSNALVSGSGITAGAYVLYTGQGDLMSTGADPYTFFSLAVFPDDGSEVLIKEGSAFSIIDFPASISFNARTSRGVTEISDEEREGIGRDTARRTGIEGAAPETEVGCHDNDVETTPFETESYVSVVRAGGMSLVIPDYCVEGDNSIVYEASCVDGEAKVTKEECPVDKPCSRGACKGSGTIIKFCIDSDRKLPAETEGEGLTKWAQTKSTTVGYYAATEGGREFGAWNDYCRDSKTLIEYYCGAGDVIGLFREIVCTNGCSDGACEEPPYCYDTDGGSFENVKGTVKAVKSNGDYVSNEDTCKNGTTVIEYACNPSASTKSNGEACALNAQCRTGYCNMAAAVCAAPPGMRSNGQPCYADEQCTSNFCDMSTLHCAVAAPVKANGEACTLNAQCRTGYCNMAAAVCADPPGMRSNGQPCYADEQCTSNFCDMSTLRCAAAADIDGFDSKEIACAEGKVCQNGKCTLASAVTVCNECDALNSFNIKVGQTCNENGTPATWELKSCPLGTYCKAEQNKCVAEPMVMGNDVTDALNRRKAWAVLMDDSSWWLENVIGVTAGICRTDADCTTGQTCTSGHCVAAAPTVRDEGELLGDGETCLSAAECNSGICTTTSGGIIPIKVCAITCARNSDCASSMTCTLGQCVIRQISSSVFSSKYRADVRDLSAAFGRMI